MERESSRRTFLKQAAGGAATQLFPAIPLLIGAETSRSNPGWYNRPMRWAQQPSSKTTLATTILVFGSNTSKRFTLRNAVLWATNEPAPVTVEGKGVLDTSVWGEKNSMTVHLVNLTNPMMMKGPLREVIPLPNQEVSILIPEGRRVSAVRLLVAGRESALP